MESFNLLRIYFIHYAIRSMANDTGVRLNVTQIKVLIRLYYWGDSSQHKLGKIYNWRVLHRRLLPSLLQIGYIEEFERPKHKCPGIRLTAFGRDYIDGLEKYLVHYITNGVDHSPMK